MKTRRSGIKLTLALIALIALGLYAWRPLREMFAVRELERIIAGGDVAASSSGGIDASPLGPGTWGNKAGEKLLGYEQWRSLCERFLRFFTDGPITAITIRGGTVTEDLDGVMARLPQVTYFAIEATAIFAPSAAEMTESDAHRFCRVTQAMPRLELLQLQGNVFSDASLAGLRGHPRVHTLMIHSNRVTVGCVDTLRTLPALDEVTIGHPSGGPFFDSAEIGAIRSGLPRVVVHLPEQGR
ncbi:hypothetical protein AYO49_03390 [Verrucomicrobiaceae bacterium SCGC AG-212-N21]|nr:hypothetical protein AYO49_03390 [Verrucomicrobiaceae bacterium SCGC AG-212-N21]